MMTTATDGDLHAINHAIGEAESTADRGFFERLLAPAFSMVRPDGTRFDDRTGFLDGLTVSPARRTRVDSITVFDNRAVAVCAVIKEAPDGSQQHRNIRVFSRPGRDASWQLVSWVTEPLLAPGEPAAGADGSAVGRGEK